MTNQCRLLIILGIAGAIGGTLRGQDALTVLSLALILWLFLQWCLFEIRINLLWPKIQCNRIANGRDSAHKPTLWAGRHVDIEIHLTASGSRLMPMSTIRDWIPDSLEVINGQAKQSLDTSPTSAILKYRCKVLAAGIARFPGVHFQFGDAYGLFLQSRFKENPQSLRCLPSYDTRAAMQPTIKRLNSLPQHGIHRLQRTGLGSELLELREYQLGDPPKSIAWKASARRDRLMTRQYESEVPIRVTLIVDGSNPARDGEFGSRVIDRQNAIAASVAHAAISVGDAVGLVLLDQHQALTSRPAYGERALHQCLRSLADFSIQSAPPTRSIPIAEQTRLTRIFTSRYPQQMDRRFNPIPFTWFPILFWNRKLWQNRIQMSCLVGQQLQLSETLTCKMCFDDELFFEKAGLVLNACGRSLRSFAGDPSRQPDSSWAPRIGNAINSAIARARDNEVFVILADLSSHQTEVERVLEFCKVAIARHHRVLFLSPIPDRRKRKASWVTPEAEIHTRCRAIEDERHHRAISRQVGKIGAVAAFAAPDAAASLVMKQAEMAGSSRSLAGVAR